MAVHSTPLGDAYQIVDTLRLMDFLRDMRKEDMFIRYVHQLVAVQVAAGNSVEAALSLRLHADLYAWDAGERVPALLEPALPEQTAFERREQLFLQMVGFFEDGGGWEHALDTYRELAAHYEHTVFDYAKLARCYRAMAALQERIACDSSSSSGSGNGNNISATSASATASNGSSRHEPRFYRVAYYGMGFPSGLRDRQFVVQAGPAEEPQLFADRLLMQHPAARTVDGPVDSVEGQFLHIVPVVPEIDYAAAPFRRQRVAPSVRRCLALKGIRAFGIAPLPDPASSPSSFPSAAAVAPDGPPDGGATGTAGAPEGWTEWTEKTVFVTAAGFPAILKRSEIVDTVVVGVSPVERAIAHTIRRTAELAALERQFRPDDQNPAGKPDRHDRQADVGLFSIALTNAVDATKSVARFRTLLDEHETKEELRDALHCVLADHVAAIRKALSTHARVVPDHLRHVQAACYKCFEATFRPELAEARALASSSSSSSAAAAAVPSSQQHQQQPGQWRQLPPPQKQPPKPHSRQLDRLARPPLPLPPQTAGTPPLTRASSIRSEAGTEKSSASRRLANMVFGSSGHHQNYHNPPPPPIPPIPHGQHGQHHGQQNGQSRSRSGSVSTSRSKRSAKSTGGGSISGSVSGSVGGGGCGDGSGNWAGRPKTPGRIERGVGSVRRRWSQISLGVKKDDQRERGRSAVFGRVDEGDECSL